MAVASQGTVNALFRVGDEFVARFPLTSGDVDAMRQRLESEAQAWAFEQATGAVWYYVTSNPVMSLMGQRTLTRIMTRLCHGSANALLNCYLSRHPRSGRRRVLLVT